MKRFLFLSALASVALAGCVNDEAMEVTSKASDQKITFNAPIVGGMTRIVTGEQPKTNDESKLVYSTDENFCVYAVWSEDKISDGTWDGKTYYMNDVEVSYNATGNSWASENVTGAEAYYWPKVGYLTFAAYSPAGIKGAFGHSYGKNGLIITNFTVKDKVAEQYDLMFSERSYDRQDNTNKLTEESEEHTVNSYSGVDILFKHALSSIKFKVKAAGDYGQTKIHITGITILNAYYKGNFAENYDETNDNSEKAAWTVDNASTTSYAVWTGNQEVSYVDGSTVKDAQGLQSISDVILMPQALKHDDNDKTKSVAVKVNYTITSPTATAAVPQVATLYLDDSNNDGTNNDYYKDDSTDITSWEMGKRYTYTITIALNKIYFSPEVTYWDDVVVTPDLTI